MTQPPNRPEDDPEGPDAGHGGDLPSYGPPPLPRYGPPPGVPPQYGPPPVVPQQYGPPAEYGPPPQYGPPGYGPMRGNLDWPDTTPPRTYLLPAILATLFCFLPTGIAAIVFAAQTSSRNDARDYAGAAVSSARARLWVIVTVVLGLLLSLVVVTRTITGA